MASILIMIRVKQQLASYGLFLLILVILMNIRLWVIMHAAR